MADAYLELGRDGTVADLDPHYLALLGVPPAEIAAIAAAPPGERLALTEEAACRQASDPDAYRADVAGLCARPDAVGLTRIALRDGRTVERYAAPRRGADGQVIGRALFLRDITERCRAERELDQRARQQAALAQLSDAALGATDLAPVLELAARLVASTLELDVVHVLELGPDGLRLAASNIPGGGVPEGMRTGSQGSMAAYVLERKGAVVTADVAHDPRFDAPLLRAAGVVSGAGVMMRGRDRPWGVLGAHARRRRAFGDGDLRFLEAVADVLAAVLSRRAAETALLERERQLRAVFDNALEGLVTFDSAGRVVDANPATCRLFGRAREELLAASPAPLIGLEPARVEAGLRALLDAGHLAGELEIAPPGAARRQVEVSAVANILPGLHLLAFRDVTEKRAVQLRLALADRMASAGTLAAGVAHELNNPLAALSANASWLGEQVASLAGRDDLLQAVGDVHAATDRMRTIIRDLTTFAHADQSHRAPVELAPLLESCLHVAGAELRRRARVVLDLQRVAPVVGNEARLGQVFLNLLLNAAQAIPDGAPERNVVRVATRAHADGRVAVEVQDTGCGIAPEHRARLFDPFFTTKAPGVGTGLGLSLCHSFVNAFGGAIEVDSAPGVGSTFRVLLRAWGPDAPLSTPPPVARVAPTPPPPPPRARILVVDDEEIVAAALIRALQAEHDVTAVARASEALARLDAGERYDLVISDLLMPEVSGIDLWRALQGRAPELARRMIFVTGGAFTDASRAFVEAHGESCLQKPFDVRALRELVQRRLGRDGAPARPPR